MSIVVLKKATIYASASQEKRLMPALQSLGFLHLIPLAEHGTPAVPGGAVTPEAKEALRFLTHTPGRRKQLHNEKGFDALHVKAKVLQLKARLKALKEERDKLKKRLEQLRPWGEFSLPPLEALQGQRLWFYAVPLNRRDALHGCGYIWEQTGKDHRFAYVVVISPDEPELPAFERTHAGTKPLSAYDAALEIIESGIEDAESERIALTKWLDLYANSLHRLLDLEALQQAAKDAYRDERLLVMQAWLPAERSGELRRFCTEYGCALTLQEPGADETPPTLLHNPAPLAAGEDLLGFYMTPGYRQNDPSSLLFFSFVLFFGMILGDAGYGALAVLATLAGWRVMGKSAAGRRYRILFALLAFSTTVWGVLVGSYFGLAPGADSLPGQLQLFDVHDYATMMALSVGIGGLHLILANLAVVRQYLRAGHYTAALAPAGWVCAVAGALWAYYQPERYTAGFAASGVGLLLVALFSGARQRGIRRVGTGVLGLTRITAAFGDILSYLRLFALGLATSSMAIAFNDLAAQVAAKFAGLGVLMAIIVLLLGHTLNLALGIVSGVVHGLRLNLIEYLNWGMPEEGYPFRPFDKKERRTWNH